MKWRTEVTRLDEKVPDEKIQRPGDDLPPPPDKREEIELPPRVGQNAKRPQ